MKKITVTDLSAEEKLRLICAQDFWHTVNFNGKIPQVTVSDGPVGLRKEIIEEGKTVTVPSVSYPSVQSLANSWSKECARIMGEALADDCIEHEVDILLAPGVNIKRHPLNGRNFEYFSEDPYLAGTLAYEYIEGLQQKGIGACLKHFCCNNLEYNRFEQSSEVDERTLREIYYKPFELACKAKPVSIMSAYNRINGTYASEYKKGFDVLRKEFGFDGVIYSDWEAVRNRAAAAKAGCDFEFPYSEKNYEQLKKDYAAGIISEEEVNACAERILQLVYRLDEMKAKRKISRSTEERLNVAQRLAEESIVLLKNEGNILPLKKGTKTAVCGCYAKPERGMLAGGGSSQAVSLTEKFDLVSLLEEALGVEIPFETMYYYDKVLGTNGYMHWAAKPNKGKTAAALAEVCVVCAGTGAPFEYESLDRADMRLPVAQERAILELAEVNPNTVVVLFAGSAIDVSAWADRVKGIVYAGFCGERGLHALCNVLCGKVNPSGKLSETFPKTYEDSPAAHAYVDASVTCYEEGLNVGYRYFDRRKEGVRYPFGYGLSYSQFDYCNLKVTPCEQGAEISFTVENRSDIAGKEVSQVYIKECAPLVYRPEKELKVYAKTEIEANSRAEVNLKIDLSAFAHWSVSQDRWIVSDGVYEILVGASSADIRLSEKVLLAGGKVQKIV